MTIDCPQGYKTPYDILREECKSCLTKVCIVPSVNHEIGEWYPYWLDELEHFKGQFISMIDQLRIDYMHGVGRILEEGLSKAGKKYGERSMQEASKKIGMGLTKTYEALNFYKLYPDIKQCPASSYAQVRKLIDAKGDQKVLSQECEHKETELRRWCIKCGKVVK